MKRYFEGDLYYRYKFSVKNKKQVHPYRFRYCLDADELGRYWKTLHSTIKRLEGKRTKTEDNKKIIADRRRIIKEIGKDLGKVGMVKFLLTM